MRCFDGNSLLTQQKEFTVRESEHNLALNDRNILPEREIVGILRDAAAAHEQAPPGDGLEETHNAVADLINRIIAGGNSVRRR